MASSTVRTGVDEAITSLPPPSYENPRRRFIEAPPGYLASQRLSRFALTATPYVDFPVIMTVRSTLTSVRTFSLGSNRVKRTMYCIASHTGFSATGPLGANRGFHLHNGPSTKDPILAAVGEDVPLGGNVSNGAFDNNSLIWLPPPDTPQDEPLTVLTKERMRSDSSVLNGVTFGFSIEVKPNNRRERFEWRKISKSDPKAKYGGYRLMRLPSWRSSISISATSAAARRRASVASGSPTSPVGSLLSDFSVEEDAEDVAVLSWPPLISSIVSDTFTLELVGDAAAGILGQRCILAIVITAMRIWDLRSRGQSNQDSNSIE